MKLPQFRQYYFFIVSHILETRDVFSQVLRTPYFEEFFTVKDQNLTSTSETNSDLLSYSTRAKKSCSNQIFNWYAALSVLPYRTNNWCIENNKRSFNLLIFPNGLLIFKAFDFSFYRRNNRGRYKRLATDNY